MIEQMRKAYLVARARDRERLLEAIRELGVVHLVPVDSRQAVPDETTKASVDRLDRAIQVLGAVEPAGAAPSLSVDEAARETLAIERAAAERRNRLTALYRQLAELAMWGDTRLEDFARIEKAGLAVAFYVVPAENVTAFEAACVEVVGQRSGGRAIVAVAGRRDGGVKAPEGAEEVPLPKTDRPSIRAEAAEIDAALKRDAGRLAELAGMRGVMGRERAALGEKLAFGIAVRGGQLEGELFAVQGWIPAKLAGNLAPGLVRQGMDAAVETFEPAEGEAPPTLLSYPWWTKPIKALFDILGTFPGYREADLTKFFMVALPLFAGIIIGDAGYGLVFILAGLLFYKKIAAASSAANAQLLLVIGFVTFAWGILTGGVFGLGPIDFAKGGGIGETIGLILNRLAVVGVSTEKLAAALAAGDTQALELYAQQSMDALRLFLMKVSFVIAVIHLVTARLREAVGLMPNQQALASVGWATMLAGMFGIVWFLFFTSQTGGSLPGGFKICLLVGFLLAVLFSAPDRNPLKRVGIGFAASLLPALSTFGDTMSYIRLMAVSIAGVYIAQVFNMMSAQLASAATWFAGAPVAVFGHALNIGLCLIAILAHGVRLNMLEFSSNAGVQWGGYPFEPFAKSSGKES